MLHELHEYGINARLSISLEENPDTHERTDSHVSVFIEDEDGNCFIADPVETVKVHGDNMIFMPLSEFQKLNGKVWVYNPYGEHGSLPFFGGFLDLSERSYDGDES